MVKILLAGLMMILGGHLARAAESMDIQPNQLRFHYQSADGEIQLTCAHKRIRDLPDWRVICGSGTKLEKEFAVHLVVLKGKRPLQSEIWYRFLYWVTDRQSDARPVFNSTSLLLNLKEGSKPNSLSLDQGVENDYAQLSLVFRMP